MDKNLKGPKRFKTKVDDHFFNTHEYDIDYDNNEIYLTGISDYSQGLGG